MQRLSPDNFGASENILTKFSRRRDELWSTNKNVLVIAHIDPPKRTFYGRLHFGPWGCCPLKFFYALQID